MAGTAPTAQLAQPLKMVKRCINPVCIQWGLWQQSSGRNEEALGATEVPFVLGEGTGDFLTRGLSWERGGRAGRTCRMGKHSPTCSAAVYQPVPAVRSRDFRGVLKVLLLFLGTWEGTGWVRPQLWLIHLFSTSTSQHLPFRGALSQAR